MKKNSRKWKERLSLFLALIPLIGFIIFNGFPLIISMIGLFCNVDLYDLGNIEWNNFEGFKSVFIKGYGFDLFGFDVGKYFYKSFGITMWVASTQLVTLGIALAIAVLLERKLRGTGLFRVLFFIPYICSSVSVGLMWKWVFAYEGGILNSLFGTSIEWLKNPTTMTWCIIIAVIWQAPGYGIVMYKAAFSNVNQAFYEAASIDGAGDWKKFLHITIPSIAPTTFYLLMAGVTAGVLTYDIAALVIEDAWGVPGGVESMGLTLMRLVYYLITNSTTTDVNGVSYMVSCASVISWILFIITGGLSMILFRMRERSME